MIYIKRKESVLIDKTSGSIVNSNTIEDKITNTYSAEVIDLIEKRIYENIYPIGRVIIDENVDSKGNGMDYSNYLGFTWEKTLQGVSPIGINVNDSDFATMAKTGGEKVHTLSTSEIPSHNHRVPIGTAKFALPNSGTSNTFASEYAYNNGDFYYNQSNGYSSSWIGGSSAHNNLQPYKIVAFWKRIK